MHDQFISTEFKKNWLDVWRQETFVNYDWSTSSDQYDYAVMLFKGFSVLTNLGYESGIPELSDELVFSIIAQNIKVIFFDWLFMCDFLRLHSYRLCCARRSVTPCFRKPYPTGGLPSLIIFLSLAQQIATFCAQKA